MFFTNENVFLFWSHLDVNFQFRHFDTKLSEGYRKMERYDHFNVFFLIFLRKRSTVRNTNVVVFLLKMTGWALNTFYSSSVCWKLLSYLVISSSFCVCVFISICGWLFLFARARVRSHEFQIVVLQRSGLETFPSYYTPRCTLPCSKWPSQIIKLSHETGRPYISTGHHVVLSIFTHRYELIVGGKISDP